MNAHDICLYVALSIVGEHDPKQLERYNNCIEIVYESEQAKVDTTLMLAIAWEESYFTSGSKSSKGAVGPMQVLPKYWCKGRKNCNLVKAGIRAYKAFLKMYKTPEEALCHYNGGVREECYTKSKRYAKRVLKYKGKITRKLKELKEKQNG